MEERASGKVSAIDPANHSIVIHNITFHMAENVSPKGITVGTRVIATHREGTITRLWIPKDEAFTQVEGYPGIYSRTGNKKKLFYIAYRHPSTGKRVFESAGKWANTPAKASIVRERKLSGEPSNAEARRQKEEKKRLEERRHTFDKLWEKWLADPDNEGKAGNHNYDIQYKKHIGPFIGSKIPEELTELDFDRIRRKMVDDGLARETVKSALRRAQSIAQWGFRKKLCGQIGFYYDMDPKRKPMGKEPKHRPPIGDDQVEKYIRLVKEYPDVNVQNFILTVAATGWRKKSVRNIQWDDVSLVPGREEIFLRKPKNREDRPIPIGKDLADLLRNHPRERGVPFVFAGNAEDGGLSYYQITRIPSNIRFAAGLTKAYKPLHIWRSYVASRDRERGVPTGYTQDRAGWNDPGMVDHYARRSDTRLRAVINEHTAFILGNGGPKGESA